MSRAKTLVTGATGMTGSHTVRLLLKRGHTVRVLAHNEDERSKRLQELGAEVVIGDLLNLNDVRLALSGIRGAYFVYPLSPYTRSSVPNQDSNPAMPFLFIEPHFPLPYKNGGIIDLKLTCPGKFGPECL